LARHFPEIGAEKPTVAETNMRFMKWAVLLAALGTCALVNPNTTRARAAGGQADNMAKPAEALGVLYFPAAQVTAALQNGTTLLTGDNYDYRLIGGRHNSPGGAELHKKETDVFYVVDGSATFITGGTMLNVTGADTDEPRGSGIDGGVSHTLSQGDVIVIPAGTPHWYKEVPTMIHYFVVKIKTN
jgi:mannose-6-phosphate isomerase-like protein (cupin superfamily)